MTFESLATREDPDRDRYEDRFRLLDRKLAGALKRCIQKSDIAQELYREIFQLEQVANRARSVLNGRQIYWKEDPAALPDESPHGARSRCAALHAPQVAW